MKLFEEISFSVIPACRHIGIGHTVIPAPAIPSDWHRPYRHTGTGHTVIPTALALLAGQALPALF